MADPSPPEEHKCRICLTGQEPNDKDELVSPCECTGTMEFVHKACLKQWVDAKKSDSCEVCKKLYNLPLRFVGYINSSEYLANNGRRHLPLLRILAHCVLAMWLSSLIFGWVTAYRVAKHMYREGSLPRPLTDQVCDSSTTYSVVMMICSSIAIGSIAYHVRLWYKWMQKHGALYEVVI